MKATEAKLLQILSSVSQFIIPIYQRTYSWTQKECQQLWNDILRAGASDAIGVHFIGSVVYIEERQATITVKAPKLVIDGQQRLTTVTLLLSALADVLSGLPEEDEEPFDGFSPPKIRQYYLTNPLERKEKRFKLLLSDTDRDTLMAVVDPSGAAAPQDPSIRIQQNQAIFLEKLRLPATDLAVVCRGISKLLVVDVALSRDKDNPQLIFESMNSTGRELSQADLIRNYVLIGQPPDLQERLYTLHWRPMELAFGQEAYSGNEFSAFMRDFLTLKTAEVPRLDLVYEVFKKYEREPSVTADGIEALLADLHATAIRYCRVALDKEPDSALQQAFHDLRELKVNVVTPLLLELYGDHEAGLLSRGELLEALRLLEAYVFRRAVCAIPVQLAAEDLRHLQPGAEAGELPLPAQLQGSPAGPALLSPLSLRRGVPPRGPDPQPLQVQQELLLLAAPPREPRAQGADRRGRVHDRAFLPQNPELPAAWREALGSHWRQVREE
jgi:uncharacterized protein with ParB-like and HNH nuclease domain